MCGHSVGPKRYNWTTVCLLENRVLSVSNSNSQVLCLAKCYMLLFLNTPVSCGGQTFSQLKTCFFCVICISVEVVVSPL